jgi:hypothetical protein
MSGIIDWKQAKYSGERGTIADGRVEIGSINWGTTRNDPKPWKLRIDLPGFRNERAFTSMPEAEEAAEVILKGFVELISPVAGALVVEGGQSNEFPPTSGMDRQAMIDNGLVDE